MSCLSIAYTIWLAVTVMGFAVIIAVGARQISRLRSADHPREPDSFYRPLEILVPVAGQFPGQRAILSTLLEQTYPAYHVIFIVESEHDTANGVLDELCSAHARARKVVSGISSVGAQKNYNLIAGVAALRPDTEIIVFCDSTNGADPGWLERFTRPLLASDTQVVTTFRTFRAIPETVGGVSQVMYGAFLRILASIRPKPWGGATAIGRDTFHRLNVVDAWANTVVDDLVLGNLLEEAGIAVRMDPFNLLTSPLLRQSIPGFLQYLDRQLLFPKFTNPEMWISTVVGVINLGATLTAALLGVACLGTGIVSSSVGGVSLAYLVGMSANLWFVHRVDSSPISFGRWLWNFIPLVWCGTYLCVRTIFRDYIDWHGRRYHAGRKGIVLRVTKVP